MGVRVEGINKKAVCFKVCKDSLALDEAGQPLLGVDGKPYFTKDRKVLIAECETALIAAGMSKYDLRPALAPSYVQMARMEYIDGRGGYAHHKNKKKSADGNVAPTATVQMIEEPVMPAGPVIPEDAQWQAVAGEMIEYFKNRQAATAFVKNNGGNDVWTVTKISAAC